MRAYRHTAFTGPEGLTLVEEPAPEPGPGQVFVRIRATSLNYRDIAIATGAVPWPLEPGRIALSDAAGEVEAVGPGVTRVTPGDAVTSTFAPTWFGGRRRDLGLQYGVHLDGWLADYVVVSEEAVVRAPEHLSFEEAATMPCAALTAWSALAAVQPGDTVLTQGSGGVSLFAIQIARAKGARVIATTSSPAKAERLRALGADATIDYATEPQWGDHVLELTGGRGADRVVEMGGGVAIAESVKAVAVGGEIALVGLLAPSEAGLSVTDLFLSQATIRPIGVGSRDDLEALGRAMQAWELRPVIDRVHDFEDARAAFAAYGRPDQFGKLVIRH
jgi:NADPH:quinone reductase-like Zn-dependent oxidoreductase